MNRSSLGSYAEQLATEYLQKKGYDILARNYRKPWGELDVVARRDDTVVFVEVKANQQLSPGFEPELRADWKKQQKLLRTARTYLAQYKLEGSSWQIDVISVIVNKVTLTAQITHFKNIELT